LEIAAAGDIRRSGSRVSFKGGLQFTQILGVVTMLVAGVFLLFLLMARDWPTAVAVGASAWLRLYGANVLLASFRFPRWLRRALTREDIRS